MIHLFDMAHNVVLLGLFMNIVCCVSLMQHPGRRTEHKCGKGQILTFDCVDGSHGPRDGLIDVSELEWVTLMSDSLKAMDHNHDGTAR